MKRSPWFRYSAFLLTLLLLSLAFYGRPAQAQDELSGELTLWHGWTGAEADTLNNDILPAWQALHPNVTIKVLAVPFDQLKSKYSTEAATGGGPDLLIGPLDWIGELATAELILPLDDLADQTTLSQYLPATVDALRYEGQLYGLPESFEAVALFYNRTFVQEPPKTTEELDALVAEIAAGGQATYGMALRSGFYHSAGFLFGFGAQLFDEENKSALNSPETVAFLTWIKELSEKPGYWARNDDAAMTSLFKEGKAAMVVNGPWFVGDAQGALGKEVVGVAPMPLISEANNAAPKPFLGVKHIMINANSTGVQAELAFEFAKWFTGPEAVTPLAEKAGHLPAHLDVDVSGDPIAAGFVEQARNATPMPTIPQMGQVWEPADNMITRVLSGDATPEQAAADAEAQINRAIEAMEI